MACLSYLEPGSFNNARYLVRRLRRRLPQAKIVDGFWTLTAQEAQERDALGATRADCVVTSLRQAVQQVVNTAKDAASADLVGEIRAPAGAPLAAADGDTVMEDKADRGRVTPLPPS
jgi:predicted 2-oxoglutarate/Fe(II)-dependent dioxygenase YbiX